MSRIHSYKNYEDFFCFGIDKKRKIITEIREFLKLLGDKHVEDYYKPCHYEKGKEGNVTKIQDSVDTFILPSAKILVFWGEKQVFVTAFFTRKKHEFVLKAFKKAFKY